jgi:hypothetical protein
MHYVLLSASNKLLLIPIRGISGSFSRKYSCEVSGTGNKRQLSVLGSVQFNPVVNNHCLVV